jgi:hypothetical protein
MNHPASRARVQPLFCLLTLMCLTGAALARPLQVEDLQNLFRVGESRISPDGQWAVFTVTRSDLAKNRSATNLWRVSTAGGEPEQLTFVDHGSNSAPRWSPDGRYLYFLSSRLDDNPQVFRLSVAGGDAMQLMSFATGWTTLSSLPTAIPLQSSPVCFLRATTWLATLPGIARPPPLNS